MIGGLGEAVGSLLLRNGQHPRFDMIGLPDAFLDAGALPTLHDRYGISTEAERLNFQIEKGVMDFLHALFFNQVYLYELKQSNHLNSALTNVSLHPVSNLYVLHNLQVGLERSCPR